MMELVIALSLMSVLVVGMGTAVSISLRALDVSSTGPSVGTVQGARIMEQIIADLRMALVFQQPLTPTQIQFTVPDRDGDATPERITYIWSGDPDYELTRQFWPSKVTIEPPFALIASDVRQFDLSYLTRTWGQPPLPPDLESDEVLLMAHDDAPDFGNRVLMVMTDSGSPTLGELTRESLIESWGMTVTRIGATASEADLQLAADNADVVYISAATDPTDLAESLRFLTIGVVNEQPQIIDDLGFASGWTAPSDQSAIQIDATVHHVTSPFMSGPVPLFDADEPVIALSTNPDDQSPDLNVLASWGTAPALATLMPGDTLEGGTSGTPGTFGYSTVFTEESKKDDFDKKQVATQVVLSEDAIVTAVTTYLYMDRDKDMRFGIYTDDNGEPGTLIEQTDKTKILKGTGWVTVPLRNPIPLPAGVYWLSTSGANSMFFYYDPTGGLTRYADPASDPKDGLMTTWTNTYGPSPNNQRVSIRAEYVTADFAPGRRVQLPWGGAGFNIMSMADAGHTIMRRAIEWAADLTPNDPGEPFYVNRDDWPALYFFPTLPINVTGWRITRMFVAVQGHDELLNKKMRFQLRYVDGTLRPTDVVMQETGDIAGETWGADGFVWYEIPFNPTSELNPYIGLALVLIGKDNPSAMVMIDRGGAAATANTHLVETTDRGVTWSAPNATDEMRFYVYGTYLTAGTPQWP